MTLSLFGEEPSESAEEKRERLLEERRYLAQFDADPTPPDVARLGARGLEVVCGVVAPERILCPCAGAGSWVAAAGEVWPKAALSAMEIRPEEEPHLQHHVAGRGEAVIGDFLSYTPPGKRPNLILDNIPFKHALDFLAHGLDVVAPGGYVAWFVRMTLGDADAVNDWLEANPPTGKLEFVDRYKFRAGINPETMKPWTVDNCGYKLLVFKQGSRPFCYIGKRLPSLPPESRRWRKTLSTGADIRPGTEYLYGADVEPPALISIR